ncbi:Flp pilus assembly complex ATPase component TadA [Candidatus Woesearchaeota archaeon]|nr:Flp pilus assembly complex ATPase component TadA [Candidatus Woesearchaeota archaeon]
MRFFSKKEEKKGEALAPAPENIQREEAQPEIPTNIEPSPQIEVPLPKKESFFSKIFKKKEAAPREGQVYTEEKKGKTLFHLDLVQETPSLPEFKDPSTVDVRYPVIQPYVFIHVYWDTKTYELVYEVEEPELDEEEQKNLTLIEEGLTELINISFINIREQDKVIEFLEKNVRILIDELAITVDKKTFIKLMYYIYRDFVGLDMVEPLIRDYFIEDIECNGSQTPIYIVHRKYKNIRTNVTFPDNKSLAKFVEKLAQKAGKYVSYANPLLDGVLPDNSRVNATYTSDVSSRGPTFTIRKFSSTPWTPIHLMSFKTVSPEVLSYLWMLIENNSSIMVIGGTGSGKTSFLNALAFFIPPAARVVTIEDSVTEDTDILAKNGKKLSVIKIKDFAQDNCSEVLTLDKNYKLKFVKPTKFIKHKTSKDIYEVTTAAGRQIRVTPDHSLFTLGAFDLEEVKPTQLICNKSFIAVPRRIPFAGEELKQINLFEHLGSFENDFAIGRPLQKIFKAYKAKDLKANKSTYKWWKDHNLIPICVLKNLSIKFTKQELSALRIKSKVAGSLPVIFSVSDTFLQFIGLWLGDGSYDNYNKNRVILSNQADECINVLRKVAKGLKLNVSKMNDNCSLTINSTILYKFMKFALKLDGYSNTKKFPNFIFSLSNRQIAEVLKGYFSADGTVKKNEVCCCSQSRSLLEGVQTLLLRLDILSRIGSLRKDKCMELAISSNEHISKFKKIGFLQLSQNLKLGGIANKKANHDKTDLIPLPIAGIKQLNSYHKMRWNYLQGVNHIGRQYLNSTVEMIAQDKTGQLFPLPERDTFYNLANSDIFWDRVKSVRKLPKKERWVYDFSIEGSEKFVGQNILLHNTRELQLQHENWLPSVSRAGVGLATASGERHGEVNLFDLLKESFRQRPDYLIVGEIRGEEAFVLFQGMSSGHPSYGTMHADDVVTMVNRLVTAPINLSPALVKSLDAVCVMAHAKAAGKEVRRLREIAEIVDIGATSSDVKINMPFKWSPAKDVFLFKTDSIVFQKIMQRTGMTQEQLWAEFKRRTQLLMALYNKKIMGYREVQDIIHEYYKRPKDVLARFNIA